MERTARRPLRELEERPSGGPALRTLGTAALVGLVAGLVGSFVMDLAQSALPAPDTGDDEPATVVTAKRLQRYFTGAMLPDGRQAQAGRLVHYGLGGTLGAAYGIAAEYWPSVARGHGMLFGLSAAIVLDEMLVPAVGITRPPWRYGVTVHVYSLLSHAVFGASVEASRRLAKPIA